MIAKLFLTLALLAAFLYVLTQADILRKIRYLLYVVILIGLYFIWYPAHSTFIANEIGIGRGADLLFYVWMLLSAGVLLNLHLKLRKTHDNVTQLARHIALMEASPGGTSAQPESPDQR